MIYLLQYIDNCISLENGWRAYPNHIFTIFYDFSSFDSLKQQNALNCGAKTFIEIMINLNQAERERESDGVTGIRQWQFEAIRNTKTYSKKGKEP